MGCVHSKPETSTSPSKSSPISSPVSLPKSSPNVFKASCIDDRGRKIGNMNVEITNHAMIMHEINYGSIVWPLKTVKRYGYENYTFCFEVGRSSVHGQGIFSFRSKHAKSVYETFKRVLQINNFSDLASELPYELRSICCATFPRRNTQDLIYDEVSLSGVSYDSDLINQSPYHLYQDSDSIYQPLNFYANMFNDKKKNNDLQSNKDDEPKETEIIYTEVEISPCSNPIKHVRETPAEKSVYTTIDFFRTSNLRKKVKCTDPNVRKTRHDYD